MNEHCLPELTAYQIQITARAQTPLAFDRQPGQQLRGALFGILRRHYCPAPTDPDPGHSAICPVCWLLAREDENWWRGRDPVRAYTIIPPLDKGPKGRPPYHYHPGETFTFGVTLFGPAINLLPYLVLALPEMGRVGVGRPLAENQGRRGRFTPVRLLCVHPLTGQEQTLLAEGETIVQMPALAVTTADVIQAAERLAAQCNGRIRVRFLTPTRIIRQGQLTHRPLFRPFFGRLVDRIEGLAREYGQAEKMDSKPALIAADHVELVSDETTWVDLTSHSTRTGRTTPAGGFVGLATYSSSQWRVLLPWLVWGTLTQVGKNAVKGEGKFEIENARNWHYSSHKENPCPSFNT
ncbi:MAG: CRISPR system precrRNA processing endoribonuclease RAMP protein Cas6 [Anaerolineae bacterium]|nr:CRISPR system precrRNA processing endoribonuclease RAMP protein Cas6 [Anaerolineae bacterium]MDW8098626.1 CRISPR system precrRNA processing endoribonuclease RAMP protein Cas6 [Anaerolineae bacterium]